jgi:hypothetical protein
MEAEADDLGHEHGDGLAEHGCLGLDAAHAPADHAEAVDHGRVRIGPEEGVGIGLAIGVGEDDPGQVLEVDLVADTGVGWDDLELVERALAPPQEPVALHVALELELGVAAEGVGRAVDVGHHGVVDDQLGGNQRVDLRSLPAEPFDGVAHGGEVDDGRDAREVLHEDARGSERDLALLAGPALPAGEGFDVRGRHRHSVLVAEEVLEEDLERERQLPAELAEPVDLVGALPDGELAAGIERVGAHGP